MPDEKPKPEPEGPPAPAAPEKAARPSKNKAEEKEEPKAPRAPKKLEGVKEDFRYIVRMPNRDLDGARAAPGRCGGRSPAAGRHQSDVDDPVVQRRAPRDRPEGPRAAHPVERPHGPDGRGDEEGRPRGREG